MKKYLHKSLLLQFGEEVEPQKTNHHHCNGKLRPLSLRWLLLLQQPILTVAAAPMGLPPSNNAGLFDCCQGQGGSYLASPSSYSTAWAIQKLKNNN